MPDSITLRLENRGVLPVFTDIRSFAIRTKLLSLADPLFPRAMPKPSGDVVSKSTSPVNIRGSLGDINGTDQANN
ncbi:hypothetical protein K7X08_035519 [Anisodus acutangulus]|uniref:Uncharacterized protein n=1 Tax=Anisodus acutangulus TaxID=402998 RepID=A0A9Q1LHK1_9SOLA|nr:hypothetical protein K7X08_035519 [Anisodus acutangulus]